MTPTTTLDTARRCAEAATRWRAAARRAESAEAAGVCREWAGFYERLARRLAIRARTGR